MIASHRLASTWSRRASTQCGERNWIAERDLFKVRLKSGMYHEVIRPSGHKERRRRTTGLTAGPALSDAVPAAICSPCRPY